jgi:hypothetical protein
MDEPIDGGDLFRLRSLNLMRVWEIEGMKGKENGFSG